MRFNGLNRYLYKSRNNPCDEMNEQSFSNNHFQSICWISFSSVMSTKSVILRDEVISHFWEDCSPLLSLAQLVKFLGSCAKTIKILHTLQKWKKIRFMFLRPGHTLWYNKWINIICSSWRCISSRTQTDNLLVSGHCTIIGSGEVLEQNDDLQTKSVE